MESYRRDSLQIVETWDWQEPAGKAEVKAAEQQTPMEGKQPVNRQLCKNGGKIVICAVFHQTALC